MAYLTLDTSNPVLHGKLLGRALHLSALLFDYGSGLPSSLLEFVELLGAFE